MVHLKFIWRLNKFIRLLRLAQFADYDNFEIFRGCWRNSRVFHINRIFQIAKHAQESFLPLQSTHPCTLSLLMRPQFAAWHGFRSSIWKVSSQAHLSGRTLNVRGWNDRDSYELWRWLLALFGWCFVLLFHAKECFLHPSFSWVKD